MKHIKRYDPATSAGMTEQPDGQFVKFDDYLEMRRSLTHSRDNLLGIVGEIGALVRRDQNKETVVQAVKRVVEANI